MKISFIICTYNRYKILKKTIIDLANKLKSQDPRYISNYEIIVVDNNSSDLTKSVVKNIVARYQSLHIKYIFEKKQGITYARNLGILKSKYPLLAFIDDDILISDKWINSLNIIVNKFPNVMIFGGKILPLNNLPTKYTWLPPLLEKYENGHFWPFGLINQGEKNVYLSYPDIGIGNVVVKRQVFDQLGNFREPFGSHQSFPRILGAEDIDLIERAIKYGFKVLYCPKLLAFHNIISSKITKKYLRWRYYEHGKAVAFFNVLHRGGLKKEFISLIKQLPLDIRRTISGHLFERQLNFPYETNLYYTFGYFVGCLFHKYKLRGISIKS